MVLDVSRNSLKNKTLLQSMVRCLVCSVVTGDWGDGEVERRGPHSLSHFLEEETYALWLGSVVVSRRTTKSVSIMHSLKVFFFVCVCGGRILTMQTKENE